MVTPLLAKPDLPAAGRGMRCLRSAGVASQLPGASVSALVWVTASEAKQKSCVKPEKVEVGFSGTVSRQPPKSSSRPMPMYVSRKVKCTSLKRQYARVCAPYSCAFFCRCRDRQHVLQTARPSVRHKRSMLLLIFIWGHLTARECTHACYTRQYPRHKHPKILFSSFEHSQLCPSRSA